MDSSAINESLDGRNGEQSEQSQRPRRVWKFLEHNGPLFHPPYEPLPENIKFYYDGNEIKLSKDAEEVATLYAKLIKQEFAKKKRFKDNFLNDWKEKMTNEEKKLIEYLEKCNFQEIHDYLEFNKEVKKTRKLKYKHRDEDNFKSCKFNDGRRGVKNYKVEPPHIFVGKGTDNPNSGKLKTRVRHEDVTINCSSDSKVREKMENRGKWKEIKHDDTATWLAKWTNNVTGKTTYMRLKNEDEVSKYDLARKLGLHIGKIRRDYKEAWDSEDIKKKQLGVALYLIDQLALRAGHKKKGYTTGCLSLKKEHVEIYPKKDGKHFVEFDFEGKSGVKFNKKLEVEERAYECLKTFEENGSSELLFDKINADDANDHLKTTYYDGLTLKVFRTYHASKTFQEKLKEKTKPEMTKDEKIKVRKEVIKEVADLLNHKHFVPTPKKKNPKSSDDVEITESLSKLTLAHKNPPPSNDPHGRPKIQKSKLTLESNPSSTKDNYLDPRITIAWCNKNDIPIAEVFTKGELEKFKSAIDDLQGSSDFDF